MASYGRKRKFSGSTSFRRRSRPRRTTVRRLVAKKRYRHRRARASKLKIPRALVSYSRLPSSALGSFQVTYVINASVFKTYYIRANHIQTGVDALGANVTAITGQPGSISVRQVPKGYDQVATLYKE
eukprot:6212704-Pleurochrysis_carterae.AAC.1